jgi:hypothetical protein
MTDDRTLERAARSWIEVGPTQAPDRAVEAALLQIQTIPQERDLRIPWRLPTMNPFARATVIAVVALVAIGSAFFVLRSPFGQNGASATTPPFSPSPSPALPSIEGTWDANFTRADMLAAGIADAGEDNPDNYGHFILSIANGRWQLAHQDGPKTTGGGTYTITGSVFHLFAPSEGVTFDMPFTVTATTLTFGPGGPVVYRVEPWVRIGG